MGMERIVAFEGGWPAIRNRLAAAGTTPQMRLIDSMPAFPDEEPSDNWREVRITLGNGMITLRRESHQIRIVVWGNADEQTTRDADRIVRAISE